MWRTHGMPQLAVWITETSKRFAITGQGNLFARTQFTVLSHLGTWKPLQTWHKGARALLELIADPGIHMLLVLWVCRMRMRVVGSGSVVGPGRLGSMPLRENCMILKVQWRQQEVGDARMWNICWGRLQSVSKSSPSEKPLQLHLAVLRGHPRSLDFHLATTSLGTGHKAPGFNACSAGFLYCLGPIPFYLPVLAFWNVNVYPVPLYVSSA